MNSYAILSDLELAYKVYQFDAKAFETLYDRYSRFLFSLINEIVNDKNLSEEIITDVFEIVWRKIYYFNFESENFFTWIVQLTRNKAVDHLHRNSGSEDHKEIYTNEFENSFIIPKLSPVIDPMNLQSAFKLRNELEKAVGELDDIQKYIIRLVYYEGSTRERISEKLKIPIENIDSKIVAAGVELSKKFLGLQFKTNPGIEIIAYTLGGLENNDALKFKNDIENLSDREKDILGVFQNLFSLLPVLTEIISPLQQTKNKVALRLRKINSEFSFNKREPAKIDLINIESKSNFGSRFLDQKRSQISNDNLQNEIGNDKPVAAPGTYAIEKYKPLEENSQFKKILLLDLFLVLIISAIIGGAVYYFLQKEIEKDKDHIQNLNSKISDLSEEISKLTQNQKIFTVLNSNDSRSHNLDGTVENPSGFGRVILSANGRDGVLQLYNMPLLNDEKIYFFWLVSKGQPFALANFEVTKKAEFIYIEDLPPVDQQNFDSFIVTVEEDFEAASPSGEIYLVKNFK